MAPRSNDIVDEFLDEVQFELWHEAQRTNFAWYPTGLLIPLERKSVEPIEGLVDPEHIAKTQSTLLHFLAYGTWKDAPLRALATRFALERAAPRSLSIRHNFSFRFISNGLRMARVVSDAVPPWLYALRDAGSLVGMRTPTAHRAPPKSPHTLTPDEHVDAWRRSGTSARAYAALHGLKPSSLYSWRRRSRAHDGTPRLLPVVVGPSCACEVALPSGRTLRFPESLPPDTLRLFLRAMEGP